MIDLFFHFNFLLIIFINNRLSDLFLFFNYLLFLL